MWHLRGQRCSENVFFLHSGLAHFFLDRSTWTFSAKWWSFEKGLGFIRLRPDIFIRNVSIWANLSIIMGCFVTHCAVFVFFCLWWIFVWLFGTSDWALLWPGAVETLAAIHCGFKGEYGPKSIGRAINIFLWFEAVYPTVVLALFPVYFWSKCAISEVRSTQTFTAKWCGFKRGLGVPRRVVFDSSSILDVVLILLFCDFLSLFVGDFLQLFHRVRDHFRSFCLPSLKSKRSVGMYYHSFKMAFEVI